LRGLCPGSQKDIGANAYRFSISWPPIFPEGTGTPNAKGIDFYNRLVDELVAAGIAPFPTLYHGDLPQELQDKGGWQNRDTVKAFGDYAGTVAEKLSDRVKHFSKKAGKAGGAPKFTDDDLKVISSPLDFVGINVYRPMNYLRRGLR
jgi:beta-glucosidase/6-phospho-beta-glucosidase/beta-galactosidase